MIGVAGTVFSITLVALTLASSQFGPRLLQNFMHDKLNQVVLGTYISTFVYCLLVLRSVKSEEDLEFVPNISVLVAIILALGNIFLLIIYIHHISVGIQADKVIADISQSITKSVKTLFPEEIGDPLPQTEFNLEAQMKHLPYCEKVCAISSGYLQAVDTDSILDIAVKHNLLLRLTNRPGDYLVEGKTFMEVYGYEKVDEKVISSIQDAVIMGVTRTLPQDAEFAIHQMVEIAARALSPGINDPYTAISCIDNLTATLCKLTKATFPSPFRLDEQQTVRVVAKPLTFSGMMDAAFNQIRQFATGSPAVLIRLMDAFITIKEFARTEEQTTAVMRHADMVLNTGKACLDEKNDQEDLRLRYELMFETDD